MIYLDTSALAKAYISEVGSDEVRSLLSANLNPICVSTLSLAVSGVAQSGRLLTLDNSVDGEIDLVVHAASPIADPARR